jgi:hypothetical protein
MKPHRSKARRFFIFLIVAFVLYCVVGFVVAPPLLKNQAVKRLAVELERPVRIQNIRLNPLTLSITVEGFAVTDRDAAPLVGWSRVFVNFDPTSFFVREWRFQEITAVGPSGRLIVNQDGSLNVTDLINKFSPKPSDEPSKPAWPLRVAKLGVSGAELDFSDLSRSQPFKTQLGPVNFSLVQFHTSPNRDAPYQFTAQTEAGEKLEWRGMVSINPLASAGELSVSSIQPGKYAPYYRDAIRFDVLSGSLDVSGQYEVAMGEAGTVALLKGGSVHLAGLKIAARDSTAPVVEVGEIDLSGLEADATAMTIKAAKLAIVGGKLAVRRNAEGKIDLLELLEPVATTAPNSTAAVSAERTKPQATIESVTLRQFGVVFEDHATPRPAINTIENLEVDLQTFTLAEGAGIPVRLMVALPNQGLANVTGSVTMSPIQGNLTVDVANVSLNPISPYIEPHLNVRITEGVVSTKGEARFALRPEQKPEFSYSGELSVDRFGLVDGVANDELAGWMQLVAKGVEVKSEPMSLMAAEVTWTEPKAHVIINADRSINLLSVLKAKEDVAAAQPAPPPNESGSSSPAPVVSVGNVTINNGAFTFRDRSVQPEVSAAINQFGGTIRGLSSQDLARADVDLKASVNGSGPLTITGKLDPLGEQMAVDLKIDFKDVELTPFSPYSGRFAGYELARGKLFLDVNAKVENQKVDMTNVLTLSQFTFGPPTNSPEATKLPVRLAVALLKDTEGKIVIDMPVQGSLGDPQFRIGKVVGSVIVNLLTKAAVSPFSLLGAMFGGGGEELSYLDFAAGEADLAAEELQKLTTLTKALQARPALNLEIGASFDPVTDAQTIKQRRLGQMIRSRLWDERRALDPSVPPPEQLVVTPEDEVVVLRKLFAEKFPDEAGAVMPPPPSPVVPDPIPVPEPAREKKGFFSRATDIVTLKPLRDLWSDDDEKKVPVSRPAPAPVTPPTATEVPAGPPVEEMRSKIAGTIEVTTDDLRRLAARRAQRVRDYFVQQQIPGERLFLANVSEEGKGARAFFQLQ